MSPEISIKRSNKKKQLHDNQGDLKKLKILFDVEMFLAEKKKIPVAKINTESKSLDEIINEVEERILYQ